MSLRAIILGCGSSGGVPRIGGHWGACDPANPKNRRRRCAMLVEKTGPDGVTRVLIDSGPDMRAQLLDARVGELDGVLFTHSHADHTHGIDDLRMVVINRHERLPVWADAPTEAALRKRFDYVFETPKGSDYPPILKLNPIDGPIKIEGAGGVITAEPFTARHGRIRALGFRVGGLAYLPDANEIPDESWPALEGLDTWVVDALRPAPHPSHAHLGLALDWIARAAPRRAVLTNMHIDMDYSQVDAETPDNVSPAHDGMILDIP